MDRHLLLTLSIPALFLLVTGGIRSLVRGKVTWANFYLGLDLSLAALANGFVNVADVLHDIEKLEITDAIAESRIIYTLIFIILSGAVLLVVMLIHQRWEGIGLDVWGVKHRRSRGLMLGVLSNILGLTTLLGFIWFRLKGVL
jgi:hypothetical protein